jgi:phosphonate ABC transporter permease subunit PhnE
MKQKPSLLKSIGIGLAVVLGVVVYAYGFTVTRVDFEETRSEKRRTTLTRILRALAHPDLVTYEYEETDLDLPFYMPCPEGEFEPYTPDTSGPYLTANVACANPGDTVFVEGFNLQPRSSGPINFLANSPEVEEGVLIQMSNFYVDDAGRFSEEVELPLRQPVEQAQTIQATARVRVGAPRISESTRVTCEKIVETVFLALLATTFGTLISIPISFFAARNLMAEVKSPLSRISLSLIGWPVGILIGMLTTRLIRSLLEPLITSSIIVAELIGVVIGGILLYVLIQQRVAKASGATSWSSKLVNLLIMIVLILLVVVVLLFLGGLLLEIGDLLIEPLGAFGFFGNFIYILGDMITMLVPAVGALSIGAIVGGLFGEFGQTISDKLEPQIGKVINLIITPIGLAVIAIVIMKGVNWFYQFEDPNVATLYPGIIGGVAGLVLAVIFSADSALPTGMVIYTITRTLLNGTRSVEPLIMAIVFVAWVGLGPFAGSLALGLHTIAALSKLYSEQVESILPGPLEAVKATGANRLQTIVFAVVPQIIPPYISFTMYRWDINVRMSTIIGFVGGGGIGFVLQQNINLLNYRAAAVNMLAIAIVVATMDYISSTLRERFV